MHASERIYCGQLGYCLTNCPKLSSQPKDVARQWGVEVLTSKKTLGEDAPRFFTSNIVF